MGIGAFVKTSIINQEPEKTIVVDNTGVEENVGLCGSGTEER